MESASIFNCEALLPVPTRVQTITKRANMDNWENKSLKRGLRVEAFRLVEVTGFGPVSVLSTAYGR